VSSLVFLLAKFSQINDKNVSYGLDLAHFLQSPPRSNRATRIWNPLLAPTSFFSFSKDGFAYSMVAPQEKYAIWHATKAADDISFNHPPFWLQLYLQQVYSYKTI